MELGFGSVVRGVRVRARVRVKTSGEREGEGQAVQGVQG